MPKEKETPLGETASPGGETAPSSVELPVADSIIGRLWANIYVKEFVLMIAATVGLQLSVALIDLSGKLDSVNDLNSLYTTFSGWIGGAITAIILTAIKQGLAFCIARLAGTKL